MLDDALESVEDAAVRFFEHDLIAAILDAPERWAAATGTLAIRVQETLGSAGGAWTLHLGNLENPVVPGFDRAADAKLWLLRDGFARFLDGTLGAKDRKRLLFRGDADVLGLFGRILLPPASSLSVRYQVTHAKIASYAAGR